MTRTLLILFAAGALVWGRTALYTVDVGEFVYVTRFGERVAVHDGGTDAGLHVKAPWPVDAVLRLDRRVQSFDLPAVESLTRDPVARTVDKTLAVDAFVTWKVPNAEAADLFVKSIRTPEQAKKILGPLINGRLAAVISTMPIDDLIGVGDAQSALIVVGGGAVAGLPDATFRAEDARFLDPRSAASDPGRLTFSPAMFRRLQPDTQGLSGLVWRITGVLAKPFKAECIVEIVQRHLGATPAA